MACTKLKNEADKNNYSDVLNKCSSSKTLKSVLNSKSISSGTLTNCDFPVLKNIRKLPNILKELNTAKSILQECSTLSGDNLFDHLAELIRRIIDQRPVNVIDYFEEFSRNIREQNLRTGEDVIKNLYESSKNSLLAESTLNSLKLVEVEALNEEEEDDKQLLFVRPIIINDSFLELQSYWSLCGVGLGLDESFQLMCAIQRLILSPKIKAARFWGKIFGLNKSYFVVECDLTQLEIQRRQSLMRKRLDIYCNEFLRTEITEDNFLGDLKLLNLLEPGKKYDENCQELEIIKKISSKKLLPLPKSNVRKIIDAPPELAGQGLNKKTYFVLTKLTENWKELPVVTPNQIVISRKIKKFFTGDLEQEIHSYPNFPGVEKHYLRAIISRITASTYIAPKDYFRLQTKELSCEDQEEKENKETCRDPALVKNEKYVPAHVTDLLTTHSWVHIRPSILQRGTVNFVNVKKYLHKITNVIEEEGVEENEEEENFDKGIPIFSRCEDDTTEFIAPWTIRLSSIYNRINQIAIVKSNIWPGAYNFSLRNIADSIYFGWGQKYVSRNHTPEHVSQIQNECPFEIIEGTDPTPIMEEEFRLLNLLPITDIGTDKLNENYEIDFE